MKKGLILILICFILAGCTNKLTIDFNDKIDTKIEFSFTEVEYNQSGMDIEAIINEARPIKDSYDEIYKEVSYSDQNGNYKGEYSYTYTYDNFKENDILKRCFEYAAVEEDDKTIFIYLKGKSECAPFTLNVKADNRMMSNNADEKSNNEYIWNVQKENNDIHFNISKEILKNNIFTLQNILFVLVGIGIVIGIIYLKKKQKNNE